jgi:hypothetical protein
MTFEKFKNVFRGISASYVIIAIENKDIETIKFWAYISA